MSAVSEKTLALIGAGMRGTEFRAILPLFPELRLAAVVDPDPEAARRLAGPARAFASVGQLLDAALAPDLAIVCSPSGQHPASAMQLLTAGSDVLVEPPLAITAEEARRVAECGERMGRLAMTASRPMAQPLLYAVRRCVEEGAIGTLRHVEIELCAKREALRGWRADPELAGGGVLMELGPDALDSAEILLGPLRQIRMTAADRVQRGAVEDVAWIETLHEGERMSSIVLSWNESGPEPRVRCTGDAGEIEIGYDGAVLRRGGQRELLAPLPDRTRTTEAALARFLAERLEEEPISDGGAQTVEWLLAAARSLHERRWQIA